MERKEEELKELRFVGTSAGTICVGKICDECIYNSGKFSVFGKQPSACCFDETEKCFDGNPYYIFTARDKNKVSIFSKFRVPFDMPKVGAKERKILKQDIKSAVKNLEALENGILQARYGTTEEKSFYDIENILFYNIGTANFKKSAKNGVTFSKVEKQEMNTLRKKYNIPDEYEHYYEYAITQKHQAQEFPSLLAEWRSISLKCVGLTATTSWKNFKENEKAIQLYDKIDCNEKDTFSLVLEIEKPKNLRFNIMTAMKPLLDGLICAFHSSQFSKNELVYFAQKLNCNEEFLTSERIEILGERKSKFVQEYRNGVKFNPADDLCDYVFITVKEGESWAISGKIYSSVKCPHCGRRKLGKLVWGMSAFDEEMKKAERAGRIKFAGCDIPENKSRYYCKWCKKEF